jgi:hypothetical protein
MRCISLVLAPLLLSGCFATVPVTKAARDLPPLEWLEDCPIPAGAVLTNGDLARQRNDAVASLKQCNIDKAALREWSKEK